MSKLGFRFDPALPARRMEFAVVVVDVVVDAAAVVVVVDNAVLAQAALCAVPKKDLDYLAQSRNRLA